MNAVQMPNKYSGLEKAEVAAWLGSPVTQRAMKIMGDRREEQRHLIVANVMAGNTAEAMSLGSALAEGSAVEMLVIGEARSHVR